jgi:integrase
MLNGEKLRFNVWFEIRIPDVYYARTRVSGKLVWKSLTGTKNSERRQVPIIEPMARLLKNMRESPGSFRDPARRRLGYILAIRECQKAIDRACAKLSIKRITHHNLRHLFATASIESGVDIATVSRWLGHKDGGALAMRAYGHLRDEHSQAMAAKVNF